jgi:cytochrome oxidase Cu insertion factor (SCO1/SenC/PrrC family)
VKRAEDEFEEEGFKVIWMGFQDGKDKIMNFMTKHDIQSSVGYDERNMISSKYGIAYGAGLILIDREGIVQKRIPKGFSEDELLEVLKGVILKAGDKEE